VISKDESREWCKKSVSNGCKFGIALENFWGFKLKVDYKKSFEIFTELYKQDPNIEKVETITVVNLIGYSYMTANGVEKNLTEAVTYFKLGASMGQAHSLNNLGLLSIFFKTIFYFFNFFRYENGEGVPKDIEKSIEYYKLAFEQKEVCSTVNLGIHHILDEEKNTENYKLAFSYFTLASKQKEPNALFELGSCYFKGSFLIFFFCYFLLYFLFF
jgi:tetratricopeptide (TPR) repeat protein